MNLVILVRITPIDIITFVTIHLPVSADFGNDRGQYVLWFEVFPFCSI